MPTPFTIFDTNFTSASPRATLTGTNLSVDTAAGKLICTPGSIATWHYDRDGKWVNQKIMVEFDDLLFVPQGGKVTLNFRYFDSSGDNSGTDNGLFVSVVGAYGQVILFHGGFTANVEQSDLASATPPNTDYADPHRLEMETSLINGVQYRVGRLINLRTNAVSIVLNNVSTGFADGTAQKRAGTVRLKFEPGGGSTIRVRRVILGDTVGIEPQTAPAKVSKTRVPTPCTGTSLADQFLRPPGIGADNMYVSQCGFRLLDGARGGLVLRYANIAHCPDRDGLNPMTIWASVGTILRTTDGTDIDVYTPRSAYYHKYGVPLSDGRKAMCLPGGVVELYIPGTFAPGVYVVRTQVVLPDGTSVAPVGGIGMGRSMTWFSPGAGDWTLAATTIPGGFQLGGAGVSPALIYPLLDTPRTKSVVGVIGTSVDAGGWVRDAFNDSSILLNMTLGGSGWLSTASTYNFADTSPGSGAWRHRMAEYVSRCDVVMMNHYVNDQGTMEHIKRLSLAFASLAKTYGVKKVIQLVPSARFNAPGNDFSNPNTQVPISPHYEVGGQQEQFVAYFRANAGLPGFPVDAVIDVMRGSQGNVVDLQRRWLPGMTTDGIHPTRAAEIIMSANMTTNHPELYVYEEEMMTLSTTSILAIRTDLERVGGKLAVIETITDAIPEDVINTNTIQRIAASVGAYNGTRTDNGTTVVETLNRPDGKIVTRTGTATQLTVTST